MLLKEDMEYLRDRLKAKDGDFTEDFTEQVADELNSPRLFQDSADSFSKWFNRDEKQEDREALGFESKFVTPTMENASTP